MQKVIDPFNREEINNYLNTKVKADIDLGVDEAWGKLSQSDLSWFASWRTAMLWFFIIASCGLLICVYNYLPTPKNRARVKQKFLTAFHAQDIYINGSKGFKDFEITRYTTPTFKNEGKILFNNRVWGIPADAQLINMAPVAHVKLKSKYAGYILMGRFRWTRSNGKTTNTYYENSAVMVSSVVGAKNKMNMSLLYRNKFGKGDLLENKTFNKSFQLETADKLKSRMAFTPLVQEQFVKVHQIGWKFRWTLKTNSDAMILTWRPTWWEDNYPAGQLVKFKSKESAKANILKETRSNLFQMYLMSYIAMLPMIL